MQQTTNTQRLGTAQLAMGCWIFVAAITVCVTWPGPSDPQRVDLATASLPAIGVIGAYLAVTAFLHLGIGLRLRQALPLSRAGILGFCIDHLAVLFVIGKISLRTPSSPVYLTGMENVLGVLVISAVLSLMAVLTAWFWWPTVFAKPSKSEAPGHWTTKVRPAVYTLHLLLALGLLYSLWQLDLQPLLLAK